MITRLMNGLYVKPRYSKILKEYSYPDASDVAEKLADKFSWTIAPAGNTALNYTGLSTQVPNEFICSFNLTISERMIWLTSFGFKVKILGESLYSR
ncbi:DUF6088 family protein [Peptostreptococcus stomatis]|uniref:DUF6088 family protein n=1 Tax=Peptostreptococcus stomatis TaxID=341694 RepID=UPI002ED0900F